MKYIGDDRFVCENCGNSTTTSWGDCRVPTCNVCKGEKGFVDRILRENEELKNRLKMRTKNRKK
jgi:hypothetical protein